MHRIWILILVLFLVGNESKPILEAPAGITTIWQTDGAERPKVTLVSSDLELGQPFILECDIQNGKITTEVRLKINDKIVRLSELPSRMSQNVSRFKFHLDRNVTSDDDGSRLTCFALESDIKAPCCVQSKEGRLEVYEKPIIVGSNMTRINRNSYRGFVRARPGLSEKNIAIIGPVGPVTGVIKVQDKDNCLYEVIVQFNASAIGNHHLKIQNKFFNVTGKPFFVNITEKPNHTECNVQNDCDAGGCHFTWLLCIGIVGICLIGICIVIGIAFKKKSRRVSERNEERKNECREMTKKRSNPSPLLAEEIQSLSTSCRSDLCDQGLKSTQVLIMLPNDG